MSLLQHHQGERTHTKELLQLGYALYAVELVFTFARLMVQLRRWNQTLSDEDLVKLFGLPPQERLAAS
ncbi:hypothetical protein NDA00_29350 [Funiculus sociatus GB2-M2]|uniref:hypothetical protein n=1 Tax=Cyanophyceae TaxID=3028117 RepID=UPI001F554100|nr:hypothetical protein [Trichocoleus sp. FACHB-90]